MSQHGYVRTLTASGWDIDNRSRLDGGLLQIRLKTEIRAAIPGKPFKMVCDAGFCTITFEDDLSGLESLALDAVLAAHQGNL